MRNRNFGIVIVLVFLLASALVMIYLRSSAVMPPQKSSSEMEELGKLHIDETNRTTLRGTFVRENVTIRFSVFGEDPLRFRLENLNSEELFDGQFSPSTGSSTIRLYGGRTVFEGLNKDGVSRGSVKEGDASDWSKFVTSPEARQVPFLSRALGTSGFSARTASVSSVIHLLGMHVAMMNDRSSPIKIEPIKIKPRYNENPPYSCFQPGGEPPIYYPGGEPPPQGVYYTCVDLTDPMDPNHNSCYGMCGNGCDCWEWVCGDCCCNSGCRVHDKSCRDCADGDNSACLACYSYGAIYAPFACTWCGPLAKYGCDSNADCDANQECDPKNKVCIPRSPTFMSCRSSTQCSPQPAECVLYRQVGEPHIGGMCPAFGSIPWPWDNCVCLSP